MHHSFIVPAYGDSPFLPHCLASLQAQSIQSKCIIATSTPSSFITQQARQFACSLIKIPGGGLAEDWNAALDLAKTPYVTLAHQDDIYHATYTEQCLEHYTHFPDTDIIFTDYTELIAGKSQKNTVNLWIKRALLAGFQAATIGKKHFPRKSLWDKISFLFLLQLGSTICCPSVCYRHAALPIPLFNPSFSVNADWDAWIRLFKSGKTFHYLPANLVTHRLHKDATTSQAIHSSRRYEEDELIFSRLWGKKLANIFLKFYTLSYRR